MKKFEYKTLKFNEEGSIWEGIQLNIEKLQDTLNELGNSGWEMVNVIETNHGHGQTKDIVLIFKREKSI